MLTQEALDSITQESSSESEEKSLENPQSTTSSSSLHPTQVRMKGIGKMIPVKIKTQAQKERARRKRQRKTEKKKNEKSR